MAGTDFSEKSKLLAALNTFAISIIVDSIAGDVG